MSFLRDNASQSDNTTRDLSPYCTFRSRDSYCTCYSNHKDVSNAVVEWVTRLDPLKDTPTQPSYITAFRLGVVSTNGTVEIKDAGESVAVAVAVAVVVVVVVVVVSSSSPQSVVDVTEVQ